MEIQPIKTEITISQLRCINAVIEPISIRLHTRHTKVALSVLQPLFKVLKKKEIDKNHIKKPFTLKLKYYEAHYLEQLLIDLNAIENSHQIQTVINQLNQKLA